MVGTPVSAASRIRSFDKLPIVDWRARTSIVSFSPHKPRATSVDSVATAQQCPIATIEDEIVHVGQ